jgi:hypothetical protein
LRYSPDSSSPFSETHCGKEPVSNKGFPSHWNTNFIIFLFPYSDFYGMYFYLITGTVKLGNVVTIFWPPVHQKI